MQYLVVALHIIVALLIILVVLIQGGENVDITAAFGGVSQAAFGPRGTVSTLAKITWVLAGIFLVTSVTLSVWATKGHSNSVLQNTTHHSIPTPIPHKRPQPPFNPFQR
ncbi:MAG: preprotein translocase subunit SecG [Terriglobia bacterium]